MMEGMVNARLDPPTPIMSLVKAWYLHLKLTHGLRLWKDAQLPVMITDLVRAQPTWVLIYKFHMQCLKGVRKKCFEFLVQKYWVFHSISLHALFFLLTPLAFITMEP